MHEDLKTLSSYESPTGPRYANAKRIGIGEVSTLGRWSPKSSESVKSVMDKNVESGLEDNETLDDVAPTIFGYNDLDFYDCNITEVIKFLQKIAKSPDVSRLNMAFTKHITDALIKAREEKLQLETSIPRKLQDGWEPTINIKINDFDFNALCDLGASVSVMPKGLYDILELKPMDDCYMSIHLDDSTMKKPLGRIDDVLIVVNNNYVPVDFLVMDIECNASCPIILGRPFLKTVGAIIDMKEGNIRFQFPLKRGMEHFPRKRMKLPFESIIKYSYDLDVVEGDKT